MRRPLMHLLAGVCALGALRPLSAGAQARDGIVVGRVIDRATRQRIADAQVEVVGTTLRARTGSAGTFRIAGVPTGPAQLRAQRIGYQAVTRPVTVAAGATATADFDLPASPAVLTRITVTATGETRQAREAGNVVSKIDVDSVDLAAVPTFSALIGGRAAGVTVTQSGGTTGAGARIRIRGANSVSLSNEPLLVVDNLRVDNTTTGASAFTIYVGGQQPSRLNDLKPEDVESIDILKGPAATGLYGTAAANGVIVVTTKKGRTGKTEWNVFAESGVLNERSDYPDNYGAWSTATGGAELGFCTLAEQAAGSCAQDSLSRFNPLAVHGPFRRGRRQQYGLSVSGGTAPATYYLSSDWQQELGVYEASSLERVNLRANVTARPTSALDVTVSTGFLRSGLRLPQNDNNIIGIIGNGVFGAARDNENQGFFAIPPSMSQHIRTRQDVDRYTAAVNAEYRPVRWLTLLGTTGFDLVDRDDNELVPPRTVFFADLPLGNRTRNRFQTGNYTLNLSGTATFPLTPSIGSTTQAGFQFQRDVLEGSYAFGKNLNAGTGSLGGTVQEFAVDEVNTDNRTVGGLVQQTFGVRDRLFVSVAVRGDRNSAFGADFGSAYYPSAQASWVISDEPFFPDLGLLGALKLRAAYGQSGLRPGLRDAVRFFNPVAVAIGGSNEPGFTVGNLGNPGLKPERTTEVEGGFDAAFLHDRVTLQATYFAKRSKDALVARTLAPSLGAGIDETNILVATRFENLGAVTNKGLELTANARLLDRPNAVVALDASYSTLTNKLVTLGRGIDPILFGFGGDTQRHVEGYPLGGYWARPYTYRDANGDGVIDATELTVGDTAVFLGGSLPTRTASLSPSATFFGIVRVSALLDYRGGYRLYNTTEEFRCGQSFVLNCRDIYVRGTSPARQARAVADTYHGTVAGFIEDASFWKFRELAVTASLPPRVAAPFGATGASLTLAARNLATWSDYTGIDPEVSQGGQTNFTSADFLTQAQVRYVTARLNLTF